MRFAGAVVALGAGIALMASRWIQLLFRQSAVDPAIIGLVAGVMLVVTLVSTCAPGIRASRADPNRMLRDTLPNRSNISRIAGSEELDPVDTWACLANGAGSIHAIGPPRGYSIRWCNAGHEA